MSTRKKTKKKKSLKRFEPLIAKIPEGIRDRYPLIHQSGDEVKMSAVLLDFLDPFMGNWETQEELENLLQFGITAWNAALMSPDELKKSVEKALGGTPFLVRWRMKAALKEMVRRKEQYFADNRRMIINYHMRMTKDGPHVSVVSTLTP